MNTHSPPPRRVKKPRNQPVSSFGPEVMAALLRGAREKFLIGPLPYRTAISFHMRIHSLRRAMGLEQHPHFGLVSRAKIKIIWGADAGLAAIEEKTNERGVRRPTDTNAPVMLLIEPHDKDFTTYLVAAGISMDELKEDPLDNLPIGGEPTRSTGDFLDEILRDKKPPGLS